MKTLAILFLVSVFNFLPTSKATFPTEIKEGEMIQNVEKAFPNYHFKFYKKVKNRTFSISSFAMLGYWNKDNGCVLMFADEKLIGTTLFDKINKYKEYITNAKEKKNIVIKKENLIL